LSSDTFPLHLIVRVRFLILLARLRWGALVLLTCVATRGMPVVAVGESPTSPEPARRTLTRFQEWWDMPEDLRKQRYPYRFEWQVYYSDPVWRVLIVSDGFTGTFVHHATASPRIRSGQRLIVEGEVIPAEGLRLDQARITVLAATDLPHPVSTDGDSADIKKYNCRYARVRGYVNRQTEVDSTHLQLDMIVEGHAFMAQVMIAEDHPIPQFEGALVRVTGAYSGAADATSPEPRLEIWVANEQQVVVEGWLGRDPRFEQPVTAIEQLERIPAGKTVRVQGRVRTLVAGNHLIVRDDTGQLTIRTAQRLPLEPGATVEAIGVPVMVGPVMELREALVRRVTGDRAVVAPPSRLPMLRLTQQVRELTRDAAETGFPVRLRGVVTWSHPQSRTFYLVDASGGLAVNLTDASTPVPEAGLRIEVRGRSAAGDFAPLVQAALVVADERVVLPEARAVTLEHTMTGVEEGQRLSLSGYVRGVTKQEPWIRLDLTTSAGEFAALLPPGTPVADLAGTVVQVRGVCSARIGADRQLTGVQLWVTGRDDLTIEEPRPPDPFAVPVRSIVSLRQFNTLDAFNHRVRVAGIVLDQAPGAFVALADETHSLLALSQETTRLVPGDRIEVVGFPGRQRDRVVLREAVYRKTGHGGEPSPVPLGDGGPVAADLEGRLVHVRAILVDVTAAGDATRLVCQSGGRVFEAPLRRGSAGAWEPGSTVALTGVYRLRYDDDGRARGIEIQLRTADDVVVLRRAPWLTVRRASLIGGLLLLLVLLAIAWVSALRHRVHRQTEQIRAQLAQAAAMEAELQRASRLESLGVLAGGIAHDFNNLLTVVLGNVSLVLLLKPLDDEARRFLRESERAAFRARDLTQQLLTFARGGDPVRAAVALPDIVREAAEFALHGAKARAEFDFDAELWPADADRGQVAQVVHNLVLNAAQAMPGGGVVRIVARNDTAAAKPLLAPGRYVRLEVSDHGAGISPEHVSRIFDPYFSTKKQGNGLGLATVYSIVKKHGGHVEVASVVGQGTTFVLWLPAAEVVAGEPVPTVPAATAAWRGRVLVLDDEAPIRNFVSSLLRRFGCEVTAVGDGAAAIHEYETARAAGRGYELVILDLTVPAGLGGAETMARLRAIDPEVRAIVSSGYSQDPVLAEFRQHGFKGMVPKPYVVRELIEVINQVMQPPSG
jgi:signal transduction histidine kinase/CheY-like chemotaxis protein